MAVFFQLYPKGTDTPAAFNSIDEALCEGLGVPCDSRKWYKNWYNAVGFSLALGQSWDECRSNWPELGDVINWLEARYDVKSWSGR